MNRTTIAWILAAAVVAAGYAWIAVSAVRMIHGRGA